MPENTWFRRGPNVNRLPGGHEPQMGQAIGVPDSEPFGIYICDEAVDFIGKYLLADPRRQMGGILVGYVARSNRPFLLIRGAIEARNAELVNGGVTFSEDSWDYMQQVWEREYPGSLVVGWFCSHPGYGTALTGYDRFMHHRLFTRPWQVAFTVDPLRNASLFYRWEEDRLVPVENFVVWNSRKEMPASLLPIGAYVGDRDTTEALWLKQPPNSSANTRVATASNEAAATLDSDIGTAATSTHRTMPWLPWLVLALLVLLFLWPSLPWSLPHLWSQVGERQQELQQLQNELDQSYIQTNPANQTGSLAASAGTRASPTSEPATATTAPTSQPTTAATTATQPHSTFYEIQPGDTLWEISAREIGDPLAYHNLAQTNGITNPSLIYAGKKLKLSAEPTTDQP